MKWPKSWYVEEVGDAPSASWARLTEEQNSRLAEAGAPFRVRWSHGTLAGPPVFRKARGHTRKPLFGGEGE